MVKRGEVGSGYNGGFQLLNLVIQFNCRHIALIGFDMKEVGGKLHWHGNHGHGLSNPAPATFRRWVNSMEKNVKPIKKMGVEILNCSLDSAINGFKKGTIADAIERWKCLSPP